MRSRAWLAWGLAAACLTARAFAQDNGGPERRPLWALDRALDAAEGELREMKLPPEDAAVRDTVACGADFSMDRLMAGVKGPAFPPWAEPVAYDLIQVSLKYYQCRAFAADDHAACAPLKNLVRPYHRGADKVDPDHWHMVCWGHLNEMKLVQEYAQRSPDFPKICPPALTLTEESEDKEFRQQDIARVCRIIFDHAGDAKSACAEMAPLFNKPEQAARCLPTIRRLQGDSEVCGYYNVPEVADRCRDYGYFRRALAAGDEKLCGERPVCRVMMGGKAEVCEPIAAEARDLFCAPPASRRARADAKLAESARLLAAAPDGTPGLDERRARLRLLTAPSN